MEVKDRKEKSHLEIEQLINKDHESLLSELKEKALNIEINNRKKFENQLLRSAQEMTDDKKRNALYEVLVSLQTIWNQYQPEKLLQIKFRAAFDKGNYEEAEEIYKKLSKQGLDYIEKTQKGNGKIIPLVTKENDMLLQYNKKELTFYNLQFEQLEKLLITEFLEIIDVIVPFTQQTSEVVETLKQKDLCPKIWILLEDKVGKKIIVSTNIDSIHSIKMIQQSLERDAIKLNKKLRSISRLSFFQNHLLLVSKSSIYYQKENGNWQDWYTTKNEITSFEPTLEGFWVGHANGTVVLLKNLQYVGVRGALKEFSEAKEAILGIRETGRYILISTHNLLIISDHGGNPQSDPVETQCDIIRATILNDTFLLMLLANGMLISQEIKEGNICWQINLGKTYEMLFTFKQYVYCGRNDGETIKFEFPAFHAMVKSLESKKIYVENYSLVVEPSAPVKYISDFIGRRKILNDIKETFDTHFLFYGEPRIGKTSLLNILRDALSEKARCCVVDAVQLFQDTDTYESFESNFIKKCLEQHFMKIPKMPGKEGCNYQVLRSMVNKIKGDRNFCIICIDNFFIPEHFDQRSQKEFNTFLRSMLIIPGFRFIFTCSFKEKEKVAIYFGNFKDVLNKRKLLYEKIPLLSTVEVKNALRKNISLRHSIVDEAFKYTGKFPHLIRLYEIGGIGRHSIEEQSKTIAEAFSEKIFDYFRDLSLDGRLLIATCLYEKLIAERTSYKTFYDRFPFLKNSLPKDQLEEAIKEINEYGSGLTAQKEGGKFIISLSDNAQLFSEAVKHIPLIKNFETVYKFTSAPDQEKAQKVVDTFSLITQSALHSNEGMKYITRKFIDKFYINKLTDQGLQALKMPLTTFVVILLTPWQKKIHMEAFQDLNIEFQEFNRKKGESKIFYVLLFALHGTSIEEVKKDMEFFDRISIIDSVMMKNIILANSPQDVASRYVFQQLSIRERSPYTTSGAVPDNLFFGRQMEIALIRGLPENIGVFGTRTIGKSSLLRKLQRAFKEQKQWQVYDMDCARIGSEKSLLKNLAEKMEISYKKISDMEKFRRYVTKKAENGGHRYLFLLDEVDRLAEYDIQHGEKIFNTFNRLCNEIMKNNETAARFILFGFQQMFEQMKNPKSRLYNFMVFLPLQALDMDGAMELVTRPIENIRVHWENKEEDAKYLVDNCSRHPRLLQAACHALLSILDSKVEKKDVIERINVDRALKSSEFREICMRLYHDHREYRKFEKIKAFFAKIFGKSSEEKIEKNNTGKRQEFLSDLHRITILSAIWLLLVEGKKFFTISDIQKELKRNKIDVSPNIMRNILDRLCLSGNFRLLDESTIIAKEGSKVRKDAEKIDINKLGLKVDHPNVYRGNETNIPKFKYEFGVKIFPKLLVAHFGGIKQCDEERQKLIKKGAWQEWLKRRY